MIGISSYTPLHIHSAYSLLDGAVKIDDYVQKVKENEISSCAITDHGNLAYVPSFYSVCKKNDIQGIIGLEAYFVDDISIKEQDIGHLCLYAKNLDGYRNLLRLSSKSWTDGFYYKPRVDFEMLEKYSEGVIASSACLANPMNLALLNDNYSLAVDYLRQFLDIFRDDFYLEVMNLKLEEQDKVNHLVRQLGEEFSVPLIATNDAHYLNKEDSEAHLALLASQVQKTVQQLQEDKGFEGFIDSNEFYVKNTEEMYDFPGFEDAVENTNLIAKKCSVEIPEFEEVQYKFPSIDIPNNLEPEQYLRKICERNLIKFFGKHEDFLTYKERMEYELSVISKLGFASYFLVLKDIIDFCKERDILVGPARGSAGGSLVSYLAGVTNLDPIKYNLLFERFINPDRVSLPDIDIDLQDDRRDEVFKYLFEKYGKDKVCHIGTYGTITSKVAIKRVGRALGYEFSTLNRITKALEGSESFEDIRKDVNVKDFLNKDPHFNKVLDLAEKIEGLKESGGMHAAGVILAPIKVADIVPLRTNKIEGASEREVVSQFDMHEVEQVGLVKFDLLGLRNLSVIRNTLELVKQNFNKEIDINNLPYDEVTYDLLKQGKTKGVFQLEGNAVKRVLVDIVPKEFEDIVATTALARPGPLSGRDEETGKTMVEHFIDRKFNKEEIDYPHPRLESVLKNTYGIITYQEQVMQTSVELAGYSKGESDSLRKAVGKKIKELMASHEEKFINGCVQSGVDRDTAQYIWNLIVGFASYGFNRSHAVGYSIISYITAYLKANYPLEYMTALLNSVISNPDKLKIYLEDCVEMGINIIPVNVNQSENKFTIKDNSIMYGFEAIKQIGESLTRGVFRARKEYPFESLKDFILRSQASKTLVTNLILIGALDDIENQTRATMLYNLNNLLYYRDKIKEYIKKPDKPHKLEEYMEKFNNYEYEQVEEYDFVKLIQIENDLMGISLYPLKILEQNKNKLQNTPFTITRREEIPNKEKRTDISGVVTDVKLVNYKKNKNKVLCIIKVKTLEDIVECKMFHETYENNKKKIQIGQLINAQGKVSFYQGNSSIILNKIKKVM